MSDADTTIAWSMQIDLICKRFEAALRAGETLEGLDEWVQQVPEELRPKLREALTRLRYEIGPESIETRVLSSDAVLASASDDDEEGLFSTDDLSASGVIERCSTFQALSPAAREALNAGLTCKSFSVGTELLCQGQPARGLHIIRSGSVDIIDTQTGERIDCDGAGSVLGEMSLLTGQPCSAEVVATSDVEALVLSADDYHQLIEAHPELEIAISQLVSDRLGGRRHDALCGKTIGQYQLDRCINRGGMGVVYEAHHVDDGQPVALKMLRHRFIYDDQMQSRFDQEAHLLEDLVHPNVVRFRDHFLAYRTRFLVLDLCDGSDLFRVVRSHGPLDEPTVRAILGQIAQGLAYAHGAGVIHRDLKPGNVLVDRDGCVRLTDFGLSKLLESEVPEGKAVGTPAYMPPEQFRHDVVDAKADWYALGCLICEMLTAKILFLGRNWMEMYKEKRNRSPSDQWPDVPASDELREIIAGTLQPKPEDRRLDLEELCKWAKPVPGLFAAQ